MYAYLNRGLTTLDRLKLFQFAFCGLVSSIIFFLTYSRLNDLVYNIPNSDNRTVDVSLLSLFFSKDYLVYAFKSIPFLVNDFGYISGLWLGGTVSPQKFLLVFFVILVASKMLENRKIIINQKNSWIKPKEYSGLYVYSLLSFIIAFLFICGAMFASFDVGDLSLRNSLGRYIAPATLLVLVSSIILTTRFGARVILILFIFFFGFRIESIAPIRHSNLFPVETKLAWRDYYNTHQEPNSIALMEN